MDIEKRASRVKLLVMDCDGVLTDGRLYFGTTGEELKVFFVRDGQGLAFWHKAGYRSAIISGRASDIVESRAKELGIEFVIQGRVDKTVAFEELLLMAGATAEEVAYIGDDIPDAELMPRVGFAAAPKDAVKDAKEAAHYITKKKGGYGAVREVIDLLLKHRS